MKRFFPAVTVQQPARPKSFEKLGHWERCRCRRCWPTAGPARVGRRHRERHGGRRLDGEPSYQVVAARQPAAAALTRDPARAFYPVPGTVTLAAASSRWFGGNRHGNHLPAPGFRSPRRSGSGYGLHQPCSQEGTPDDATHPDRPVRHPGRRRERRATSWWRSASRATEVTIRGTEDGRPSATDAGDEDRGFWAGLSDLFVPDEDRSAYAEGVRRGGYLLTARVPEGLEDQALDGARAARAGRRRRAGRELAASGWTGTGPGLRPPAAPGDRGGAPRAARGPGRPPRAEPDTDRRTRARRSDRHRGLGAPPRPRTPRARRCSRSPRSSCASASARSAAAACGCAATSPSARSRSRSSCARSG